MSAPLDGHHEHIGAPCTSGYKTANAEHGQVFQKEMRQACQHRRQEDDELQDLLCVCVCVCVCVCACVHVWAHETRYVRNFFLSLLMIRIIVTRRCNRCGTL